MATEARGGKPMAPYLSPIENPRSPIMKLVYALSRRRFGVVPTPLTVLPPRMPTAFGSFYGRVSRLDKKLVLAPETAALIRARVSSVTGCEFCQDAARWYATSVSPENALRFDTLADYRTSPWFSDAERAAIDYATELTRDRQVEPETFERLARYYGEREICDIVWLVASEHIYNVTNIGLGIGSDGLCELAGPQPAAATEV
jgi:alkylhydroperoxidase family enzyme